MHQPGDNWEYDEAAAEDPIMADIDRVNARIDEHCPHLAEFLAVKDEAVAQVRLFRQSGRRATYLALKEVQPEFPDDESPDLLEHILETETQGYIPLFDIQYAWATGNPLGGPQGIARILGAFPTHKNQVRALLYFYGFVDDPPPNMPYVCASFEPLELNDAFFAIEHYHERRRMGEILSGRRE